MGFPGFVEAGFARWQGCTKDRFIDPPRLALCFAVLCGAGSVATESWHPVFSQLGRLEVPCLSLAFSFLINGHGLLSLLGKLIAFVPISQLLDGKCIHEDIDIWRFPKIGVPPNHPYFLWDFP